jgi:transcriptional regulator with XRE-family HTH domain
VLSLVRQDIRSRSRGGQRDSDIARAIAIAREIAGVTQVQLAKRMKTTQTAIARLESGRTAPTTRTLQRFAQAIGRRLVIEFREAGAPSARSEKG